MVHSGILSGLTFFKTTRHYGNKISCCLLHTCTVEGEKIQ